MEFNSGRVDLFYVKINTMDRSSKFIISSTVQRNIMVNNKKNQGFGEQNADNCELYLIRGEVQDQDLKDSSAKKV